MVGILSRFLFGATYGPIFRGKRFPLAVGFRAWKGPSGERFTGFRRVCLTIYYMFTICLHMIDIYILYIYIVCIYICIQSTFVYIYENE